MENNEHLKDEISPEEMESVSGGKMRDPAAMHNLLEVGQIIHDLKSRSVEQLSTEAAMRMFQHIYNPMLYDKYKDLVAKYWGNLDQLNEDYNYARGVGIDD